MANVKLPMQGCTECVVDVSVPINFTFQKPNFTREATFIRNGFKIDFFLLSYFVPVLILYRYKLVAIYKII